MPYAYYYRLSTGRRRTYRRSDSVASIELPAPDRLRHLASEVKGALQSERPSAVAAASQHLADELTGSLRVPPVEVVVHLARPRGSRSELHGLYEPGPRRRRARISVWMRTAQRRQVVAFRTFLRTFLHEVCHHLDYELLGLRESFHTQGFFRRESNLFSQLVDPAAE